MSFSTGRTQLFATMKELRLRWEDLCEGWNDPVRQHFEREHWDLLDKQVDDTLRQIDQLTQVLVRLKQECS